MISYKENFIWLDVVDPDRIEFEKLGEEYLLHPLAIQDCLDPEHLPKYEKFGSVIFIMTRIVCDDGSNSSNSIVDLTKKFALFFNSKFLITARKAENSVVGKIKEKYLDKAFDEKNSLFYFSGSS